MLIIHPKSPYTVLRPICLANPIQVSNLKISRSNFIPKTHLPPGKVFPGELYLTIHYSASSKLSVILLFCYLHVLYFQMISYTIGLYIIHTFLWALHTMCFICKSIFNDICIYVVYKEGLPRKY